MKYQIQASARNEISKRTLPVFQKMFRQKWIPCSCLILLFLILLPAPIGFSQIVIPQNPPYQTSTQLMTRLETLEKDCLAEVNRIRVSYNLNPLTFDPDLLKIARNHSKRMATEGFFSHADPQGKTVRNRLDDAGIKWRGFRENISYNGGFTSTVAVAIRGWLNSEGHRRNLLNPLFTHSAIGVWITSDDTTYFTQVFLMK